MATYAAFKHVELYNVGKTKKRVLRPPGGGSSDIFGSDVPTTPRSVKNHMQSNIFSCEKGSLKNNARQGAHRFYLIGDQPRRGQKNTDSYTRLFGDVDRPFTPAKNHMKSNLGFTGNNAASSENGNGSAASANGNGHHTASNGRNGKFENGGSSSSASSVSSSTENLKMNGLSKTEVDETSDVFSPRRLIQSDDIPKDEKTIIISNDIPSARSSTSIKLSEKTLVGGGGCGSPRRRTQMNSSEDSRSELTTSTSSFSQKSTSATSGSNKSNSRNPITGLGLGAEGLKSRRNVLRRDGNPVTGEGYKPAGAEINTTIPSLNGANQVINKNRIPPGGFSSGLW